MKKTFAAAIALAGLSLLASNPVTVTMNPADMTAPNTMKNWTMNRSVNKTDDIISVKDADGTTYLRGKNWTHFFQNIMYPLAPGDTVEITATVRGKGTFSLNYYCFDAAKSFGYGPATDCKLTDQWQTFSCKKLANVYKNKKTGKTIYPGEVRPLISFVGAKGAFVDVKEFTFKIIPCGIFPADFSVKQSASEAIPEFKDGAMKVSGKLEYETLIRKPAKTETSFTYTFKAKGKGVVSCGAYLHMHAAAAGESFNEVKIDSNDWKDYTVTVKCTGAKKFNCARKGVRLLPAAGASLEVKDVKVK